MKTKKVSYDVERLRDGKWETTLWRDMESIDEAEYHFQDMSAMFPEIEHQLVRNTTVSTTTTEVIAPKKGKK